MTQTTGINCYYKNKVLHLPFHEKDEDFQPGELIILQDEEKKEEIGEIIYINKKAQVNEITESISILRKTTPHDLQKFRANRDLEKEAFQVCNEKIIKHNLDMRLLKVNYSFDCNKINFVFTADTRIDFRELVKDLARHFKKQIHLEQIGPRDKAREIAGFGKCGRRFCCCQFLGRLESITMDMVRLQGMENKGSEKLSGACGKLMCCLDYETQEYQTLKKQLPSIGSIVKLKDSKGEILALDILNQRLKLRTDEGFQVVDASEVTKIIKEGADKDSVGEILDDELTKIPNESASPSKKIPTVEQPPSIKKPTSSGKTPSASLSSSPRKKGTTKRTSDGKTEPTPKTPTTKNPPAPKKSTVPQNPV